MPLSPDEERRLRTVEGKVRDLEANQEKFKRELLNEVSDMSNAAIRHVETTIKAQLAPVQNIEAKLTAIEVQNAQQTTLLAESRDEMRLAREERLKRAGAEEAEKKIKAEIEAARAATILESETSTKRKAVYATIIVATIAGFVALGVAVVNSWGGKPIH